MMTMPIVSLRQISVALSATFHLHDITFDVQPGAFIGLIGPNGAGKSTLLRAIAGTISPYAGFIDVAGQMPASMTPSERAHLIAVVPQQVVMPAGFSVYEVVAMARYSFHAWHQRATDADDAIITYALTQAGIQHYRDTQAHQLSGGEQQRVAFARALAQQPRVLLLDEVTAHLDLRHQQAILRCAKELTRCGVTVIAAMHDLNMAGAVADRMVLLDQGAVVAQGTPTQVLQQALLERVYHAEIQAFPQPDAELPFYRTYPRFTYETHTPHQPTSPESAHQRHD